LVDLGAFALVVGVATLIGGTTRSHALPAVDTALTDKVVQFIREQWGIPNTVKVTIPPFHTSAFPGFEESTVTTDDGKQPKTAPVYITTGGHYLAVGAPLLALGSDFRADLLKDIRETYKVPPATTLTPGPLVKSKLLGFNQTTITVEDGKNPKQTPVFYVTRDNKVAMLESGLFDLDVNLLEKREKVLRTVNLHNQPSVGPADAPVTIVEYADLQCPSCALFHAFLESQLLPHYGDKVRIVFKEFPWPFHDWSKVAAIANECAYQITPSSFVALRSKIFSHQAGITAANVRDAMLQYGEEVGIDRLKLAACIDAQASLPLVDEGKREGTAVGVNSTPTSFINGRMVTAVLPPEQYFALVDEALAKH